MPDLDSLLLEEPFDPADSKELSAILSNESLKRALGQILRERDQMDRLSAADLQRQEGLNAALTRQGEVRGMTLAIERLLELGDDNVRSEHESESSAV